VNGASSVRSTRTRKRVCTQPANANHGRGHELYSILSSFMNAGRAMLTARHGTSVESLRSLEQRKKRSLFCRVLGCSSLNRLTHVNVTGSVRKPVTLLPYFGQENCTHAAPKVGIALKQCLLMMHHNANFWCPLCHFPISRSLYLHPSLKPSSQQRSIRFLQ